MNAFHRPLFASVIGIIKMFFFLMIRIFTACFVRCSLLSHYMDVIRLPWKTCANRIDFWIILRMFPYLTSIEINFPTILTLSFVYCVFRWGSGVFELYLNGFHLYFVVLKSGPAFWVSLWWAYIRLKAYF